MATDPVCGMWVEERPSSLHLVRENRTIYFCSETCLRQFAQPEIEERRLRVRLIIAWPLALLVAALTYAIHFPGAGYVAAGVAAVVQGYAGAPFYRGLADAVRDRSWNMDVLIALGTTVAFGYSVLALTVPDRFGAAVYFDASSLIIALILTGNYLEHRARDRAGAALQALERLVPSTSRVILGGEERSVPTAEVHPGDLVRVRPGERFPADGIVRRGRTRVDESLLTGESRRAEKSAGAKVIAGTINGEGSVDVAATAVGSDTYVAEIGRLLTAAEMSRIPLQRTADRLAAVFVPVVIGLALVAAAAWATLGGAGLTVAVLIFVTVVITACPCAFGIATPAAILVGIGRAAESGVLFRGEDAIERTASVDTLLMDKTGTLTAGHPVLAVVRPREADPADALAAAAAVELGSEHPLARAVVDAARTRGISVTSPERTESIPGEGVRGVVGGHTVEVVRTAEASAPDASRTWSVVRRDGHELADLGFEDPLAPGAVEAVAALADDGVRVMMVTGDATEPARRIAADVGILEVRSRLRPIDKLSTVRELQRQGARVGFVGDGVNDAPALAAADAGIAIGSGTDVAREAGQVVVLGADLRGVALALRVARRTVAKARGNLAWAIAYNAVLLPIAAGALIPWLGFGIYGALPVVGAIAMALSSTSVVLNSLSLRSTSIEAIRPIAR